MNLPPSNANSGEAYAFHWNYREPPVDNICATQGAGFLRRLYAAVGVDPMLAWGSELQAALIAKATFFSTQSGNTAQWLPLINALRADLASTRTSVASHVFGIYVTYYQPSNRRLDAISLPPGTTLLQWGVAPQDDGGLNDGAVVCIDPQMDPPFLSVNATAVQESATGIRTGEGRAEPPGQNTLPNAGIITAGGLAILGLVGLGAWFVFGGARKNPSADRKAVGSSWDFWSRSNHRPNPSLSRGQIDNLRTCRQRCETDAGIKHREE